jgi:hypothetical protein
VRHAIISSRWIKGEVAIVPGFSGCISSPGARRDGFGFFRETVDYVADDSPPIKGKELAPGKAPHGDRRGVSSVDIFVAALVPPVYSPVAHQAMSARLRPENRHVPAEVFLSGDGPKAAERYETGARLTLVPDPAEPGRTDQEFVVRRTGWLRPPVTGEHVFGVKPPVPVRVWLDRQLIIDDPKGVEANCQALVTLEDRPYALRVEFLRHRDKSSPLPLYWRRNATTEAIPFPDSAVFHDRREAEKAPPIPR